MVENRHHQNLFKITLLCKQFFDKCVRKGGGQFFEKWIKHRRPSKGKGTFLKLNQE